MMNLNKFFLFSALVSSAYAKSELSYRNHGKINGEDNKNTPPSLGNDPADSWLVYAKLPGNNSRILSVNATWVIPSYPTTRNGGNAPGW